MDGWVLGHSQARFRQMLQRLAPPLAILPQARSACPVSAKVPLPGFEPTPFQSQVLRTATAPLRVHLCAEGGVADAGSWHRAHRAYQHNGLRLLRGREHVLQRALYIQLVTVIYARRHQFHSRVSQCPGDAVVPGSSKGIFWYRHAMRCTRRCSTRKAAMATISSG